ncbi:hypothetical protein [Clostridium estertheticum]|uniref:Uncharacterized protein n=1 Tax=Clostridium estertheticum TaxID=238834 RepID=A0A7Y3SZN7_9CLOT|nr:hypothetical protein [Clostridium estertheticum]NNU78356.1 hypothetical protein [Clostridium estertheticum]WBL45290.1 hypothetical protein LOR37_11300 [Clostridium estertheticum]
MEQDSKGLMDKFSKVNILLNSNIEDVIESTTEIQEICEELKSNVVESSDKIIYTMNDRFLKSKDDIDKSTKDNQERIENIKKLFSEMHTESIHKIDVDSENHRQIINLSFSKIAFLINEGKIEVEENLSKLNINNEIINRKIQAFKEEINQKISGTDKYIKDMHDISNKSNIDNFNIVRQCIDNIENENKHEQRVNKKRQEVYFGIIIFTIIILFLYVINIK